MQRVMLSVLATLVILSMAGCAAGPHQFGESPGVDREMAGFWLGLWHGFIMCFTFVISLFSDNVRIYEVYNNGNWYNFGFLLGAMLFFGGGTSGTCKRSRKSKIC